MNRRNFFRLFIASLFSPLIPKVTKLLGPIRPILSNIQVLPITLDLLEDSVFSIKDHIFTGWTRVLCDGDIIKIDMESAAQDEPLILNVIFVGKEDT